MKISVIVPVYKVEKYLKRCVNSILNQDFEDYEIILVDDGSPDGCPAICDEYAKLYAKISVIHKKNGGLWDAMVKNDADMSCSPPIIEYETVDTAENDGLFEHCSKNNVSSFELCVSAREAQAIILRGYPVGTSAWSKIIKKEYCVKHPFPKGKVMEEIARELPMSKRLRPTWDLDELPQLGFRNVKALKNLNSVIEVNRNFW